MRKASVRTCDRDEIKLKMFELILKLNPTWSEAWEINQIPLNRIWNSISDQARIALD